MTTRRLFLVTFGVLGGATALAGFNSGSDGSDGAFNPLTDVEIDLSLAADASWDTPSPVAGQGVYDAAQWAVVFKYTTIDVPAGVTVTFKNHPKGAPVVWLASGDVTILGTVALDGKPGGSSTEPSFYTEPGPGGFAGGSRRIESPSVPPSGAFGPGGAPAGTTSNGRGGGYGSAGGNAGGGTYGNQSILPLIGGSGGSGASTLSNRGGGGGSGGAILIASSGEITMDAGSTIAARGGAAGDTCGGGGSGGAIRLIANTVSGDGALRAEGGPFTNCSGTNGGDGRIRVDANVITLTDIGDPQWSAGSIFTVFPSSMVPTLKGTLVDGNPVPSDPDAGIQTPDTEINNAQPVTINIEATNIPVGTTVEVIVMPERSDRFTVISTPLADAGGGVLAATADVTFPAGAVEIQLKANWIP